MLAVQLLPACNKRLRGSPDRLHASSFDHSSIERKAVACPTWHAGPLLRQQSLLGGAQQQQQQQPGRQPHAKQTGTAAVESAASQIVHKALRFITADPAAVADAPPKPASSFDSQSFLDKVSHHSVGLQRGRAQYSAQAVESAVRTAVQWLLQNVAHSFVGTRAASVSLLASFLLRRFRAWTPLAAWAGSWRALPSHWTA